MTENFIQPTYIIILNLLAANFNRVNQCMFSGALNIDSYASGKEIVSVKMPSVSSVEGSEDKQPTNPVVDRTESKETSVPSTFDGQIPDLVTLSLLPKSQWQSLINLDIIKVTIHS